MTENRTYPIGKVASLTGLSTHTIRKWEQRYQAVAPLRSPGGDRRYDSTHVERLSLLRQLSAAGATISEIAPLPTATLQELVGRQSETAPQSTALLRIGVMSENLLTQLSANQMHMPQLRFEPFDPEGPADPAATEPPRVLIVERALLDASLKEELADLRSRSGVTNVAVVYSFAAQAQAQALSDQRTAAVRAPINYPELQRTLQALARTIGDRIPESGTGPRYSKRLLARIAALPSSIVCECPRHIAELVAALGDFESYSADCEHRQPGDAAIHAYLRETAAGARDAFERALETVAEHENLSLDE